MSARSYSDAIKALYSLKPHRTTFEILQTSGGWPADFEHALKCLEEIKYKPQDLNALNVVHVAGSKGKGSTSAFTESILRHSLPGKKIALFTSPHLVSLREMFRINGIPLSEEVFTFYFFEVWDRLFPNGPVEIPVDETTHHLRPVQFLTLMAFHSFLSLKVDATVLEVGSGGAYDTTNMVPSPIATGVTHLGLEHVSLLGETIDKIAWHKSGIFKAGAPAYTVDQPPEAIKVCRERSEEVKASKFVICPPIAEDVDIELGLVGSYQRQNASLAIALACAFLQIQSPLDHGDIPESFKRGLKETRWAGRCQIIPDPRRQNLTWYLDGAHTLESLEICIRWFASIGVSLQPGARHSTRPTRILVFNCTADHPPLALLAHVHATICEQLKLFSDGEDPRSFFHHVIFCTNASYADGTFKDELAPLVVYDNRPGLQHQEELASNWRTLLPDFPGSRISVLPSIQGAIHQIEKVIMEPQEPVQVLVTGSLYLVGGMIALADLSDLAL